MSAGFHGADAGIRAVAAVRRRPYGRGMFDVTPETPRAEVVIVGGGVAALEALIALHDLAPRRVHVTLLAPGPDFVYRPMAIAELHFLGARSRHPLARVARDFGADWVPESVTAVDPGAAVVRCASGREYRYDSLIVALGARPEPAFAHAVTLGDDVADLALQGVLADLELGNLKRLAFVAPSSISWSLPLYELALLMAADARSMGIRDVQMTVVSPEERPLVLFGPAASAELAELLARRRIEFVGASRFRVRPGEVVIGSRHIAVDRTLALPLLRGPALAGLPADERGFIPVDVHGRLPDVPGVFAAGDVTSFPIKQGGIAAKQAEAAAQAVAVRHGCALEPEPFKPALRGMLLTGADELYLEAVIAGGGGEGVVSRRPLWWPPAKIAARRLAPYLLGVEEAEARSGGPMVGEIAVRHGLEGCR
jgi:sulfide:quinone oxidoreductase